MTKIFNKLLLASATICLTSNLTFAQETTCYKNEVEKPSLIEDVTLDGGICGGKLSLNQMKNDGWDILDIKITTSQNKFNYTYYFTKGENKKLSLDEETTTTSNKEFSIKPLGIKIDNIANNKSLLNIFVIVFPN